MMCSTSDIYAVLYFLASNRLSFAELILKGQSGLSGMKPLIDDATSY